MAAFGQVPTVHMLERAVFDYSNSPRGSPSRLHKKS